MNKTNRNWVIYILRCPDTLQVRYVGWTVDYINRMAVHRYRAKKKKTTYCEKWVNSLLEQGKEFVSEIVQEGFGPWQEAEQAWIRHFRAMGMPLTNLTNGGEGCLGWKPSNEYIEKARKRTPYKWTDDQRKRASERLKGRVFTPEWKEKIRQAKLKSNPAKGVKKTKEQKLEMWHKMNARRIEKMTLRKAGKWPK